MRNPVFLLASVAALIGVAAIATALIGTHGPITPYIVGISAFITLGATFRAVRAFHA